MTDDRPAIHDLNEDLTRVRRDRARLIDPAADEASVLRFWQEIAEAEAALESVDSAAPLPVAFSAAWPDLDPP